LDFSLKTPCRRRRLDSEPNLAPLGELEIYPRSNPTGARYEYDSRLLLETAWFQKLLVDESLIEMAQQYLGCKPIIDITAMWWHTGFQPGKADSTAAQLYHFDLDRPKWLKFFFHITDVTSDSGPHCFVAGSHRSRALPNSFLKNGYVRFSDELVTKEFGQSPQLEFCVPKGTILAEDTRGLHKGKHVTKGDRLVLQIQFSNSTFGGAIEKRQIIPKIPEMKIAFEKFPRLFAMMQKSS